MTGHLPWGHSVRKQPKKSHFLPTNFSLHLKCRQKMDKIAILYFNVNFDDYEK